MNRRNDDYSVLHQVAGERRNPAHLYCATAECFPYPLVGMEASQPRSGPAAESLLCRSVLRLLQEPQRTRWGKCRLRSDSSPQPRRSHRNNGRSMAVIFWLNYKWRQPNTGWRHCSFISSILQGMLLVECLLSPLSSFSSYLFSVYSKVSFFC